MDTKIGEGRPSLQPHPAAEIFPLIAGADFDALVADIRQHGQVEPIVTHDGLILDGRHRYRACQQLGIEPITVKWSGVGTPEEFVLSRNLHRRHLNESQRAMVAARIAIYQHGGDRRSDQAANLPLGFTHKKAAEKTNISERSVRTAATVLAKGDPALVAAVDRGEIKVSTAAELVDLPADRQRELATAGKYAVKKSIDRIRKTEATRKARADATKVDVINSPEVANLPLAKPRKDAVAHGQPDELVVENDRLRDEVQKLAGQLADRDKRVSDLADQVKDLEAEIADLKADRDKYLKRAEARLTEVTGEEQTHV